MTKATEKTVSSKVETPKIETPKVEKNPETDFNFTEVDADIEFFKVKEEPFLGTLLGIEEYKNDQSEPEKCVLAKDINGKKCYLGAHSIIKYYEHHYVAGKVCKIVFDGQNRTNNNRTVNKFKFYIAS